MRSGVEMIADHGDASVIVQVDLKRDNCNHEECATELSATCLEFIDFIAV
jgi:hypothetical protein